MINTIKNPNAKFDLYFLAYDSPKAVSHGNHWTDREGIVELTHNYVFLITILTYLEYITDFAPNPGHGR